MLNDAETASSSTNIPLSLGPSTLTERETGPLPSSIDYLLFVRSEQRAAR